ncbi:ATP-binding protein [Micromonospora sp. NPDC049049]|uniref:ATP-binding protein n=1 Tax=Micromonospora sp. NPDC049049 TaxID=3155495 RepID=UPI0033C92794
MRRVHLEAAEDFVQRIAYENDPVGAVKELVWNALDADATEVDVRFERTALGAIEKVVIEDDGTGINPDSTTKVFERLGGSWKKFASKTPDRGRYLHGNAGQGRLRGFALGTRIRWTTVGEGIQGRARTIVEATAAARNDFIISDPSPTDQAPGTVFEAAGLQTPKLRDLEREKAIPRLTTEFAPYLIAYRDVEIIYDDVRLDPESAILKDTTHDFGFQFEDRPHAASIRIIEWSLKTNRELRLCDSNGMTVDILEPGIQAPGFVFTAYVSWDGMAHHQGQHLLGPEADTPVAPLILAAKDQLKEHFKIRIRERRHEVVEQWKRAEVYPYKDEPSSETEKVERETFDLVATTVHQQIPRPLKHQRAMLQLLKETVKLQPEHTNRILDDIFRLTSDDKAELDRLLNRTSLSSLIKASTAVTNRLDFLRALAHMVFDPETYKLVRERSQLHKILENETWIFGDQFSLLVSDQSLDAVLAQHLHLLRRAEESGEPVLRHDGRVGIVDLMLSRAKRDHDRRQHLVVELKAPKVTVGDKELGQIKSYALAVIRDDRFSNVKTEWDFWLVTKKMDDFAAAEAEQDDRPKGCVWDKRIGSASVRVWVKSWSEIIDDCEGRLQYFKDHFDDTTLDNGLDYLNLAHDSVRIPEVLRIVRQATPPSLDTASPEN